MIGGEHEWMFWWALVVLAFVVVYAIAFGDTDKPVELPRSSLDL